MSNFVNGIYKNQALIYKIFLYLLTTAIIVYLFPKGSKFKYDISKGKPWQYENLYAPFDFAILKTNEELADEKEQIRENHTPYYNYNTAIPKQIKSNLDKQARLVFGDSIMAIDGVRLIKFSQNTLDDIYKNGILIEVNRFNENSIVYLKKGNEAQEVVYNNIIHQDNLCLLYTSDAADE